MSDLETLLAAGSAMAEELATLSEDANESGSFLVASRLAELAQDWEQAVDDYKESDQ